MGRRKMKKVVAAMLGMSLLAGCSSANANTSASKKEASSEQATIREAGSMTMVETEEEYPATESKMADGTISFEANKPEINTESYREIAENDFIRTTDMAFSTFSIDVDTASYSNMRRFIEEGQLPPADAVRVEEFINYFNYDYPQPLGDVPFTVTEEMGTCPWNVESQLLLVGIQGKNLAKEEQPPSNLVFLIDVSGSMEDENKLPLLKRAFSVLTSNLKETDTVSIVVYAGAAGVVLDGAKGNDERQIEKALKALSAGGSTAGAEGIELAYEIAEKHFIEEGNNRVIIATDGDFNVGPSSTQALESLISYEKEKGIYITTLGFGMGNYKDDMMESLADKGNGNYAYIDTLSEARKVLGEEITGTLFTIAKDVKIQVEFNPAKVESYRLIGYENRVLAKEDFEDDRVDAGEIGAGHNVTALYEIVPKPQTELGSGYYEDTNIEIGDEYGLLKLRYKAPSSEESQLISCMFKPNEEKTLSGNLGFASAVAEYAMLLSDSKYKGEASYRAVIERAQHFAREDNYKEEFVDLVKRASKMERNYLFN